jgi:hypothetical protein
MPPEMESGSPALAPSSGTQEPIIPSGPATEVGEREARVPETPPESYTDQGPLTADKWKEKVKKFHKKEKLTADETPTPEAPAAEENEPAAAKTEEKEEKIAEKAQEKGKENEPVDASGKFKPSTKFNVMGKEYEIPKVLADVITSPEQEKELRDVYTKAMALDHVKARQTETQDKLAQVTTQHNEVVEGLDDLKGIYKEAVESQNPLLLNDFFAKLKIPPQVILQYAQAVAQYLELPADQQVAINGQLDAHRRARDTGKQNQRLSTERFQSEVQARTTALESALARPDIVAQIQAFEAQPGRKPGDFKEQVIRNGVYAYHAKRVDLPIEENIQQVMSMFGLSVAPASGNAAPAPQVPGALQPQANSATPAPAAPQAPGTKPVVPAQPHRNVPVIPGVNGKTSSPTKQGFKSIDALRQHRKEKFGN